MTISPALSSSTFYSDRQPSAGGTSLSAADQATRTFARIIVPVNNGYMCCRDEFGHYRPIVCARPATLLSLAPKSVTAPVAMGIAERIGGLPH